MARETEGSMPDDETPTLNGWTWGDVLFLVALFGCLGATVCSAAEAGMGLAVGVPACGFALYMGVLIAYDERAR